VTGLGSFHDILIQGFDARLANRPFLVLTLSARVPGSQN